MGQNGQPKKPTSKWAVLVAGFVVGFIVVGFILPVLVFLVRLLWGAALG